MAGLLAGKAALVTGSTSGIGLAMVRALAAAGADVAVHGLGDKATIQGIQVRPRRLRGNAGRARGRQGSLGAGQEPGGRLQARCRGARRRATVTAGAPCRRHRPRLAAPVTRTPPARHVPPPPTPRPRAPPPPPQDQLRSDHGVRVHYSDADLRKPAAIKAMVDGAADKLGGARRRGGGGGGGGGASAGPRGARRCRLGRPRGWAGGDGAPP
jgi:NAD(P)-dependent dehydrogenase (short-subunit alcohol dehydrogenase family)